MFSSVEYATLEAVGRISWSFIGLDEDVSLLPGDNGVEASEGGGRSLSSSVEVDGGVARGGELSMMAK